MRRGLSSPRRRALKPESDHTLRQRSSQALQAAILEQLTPAPQMKWQLRERLHEPEVAILQELHVLRNAGLVKVVGKVLDKRAWALTTWIPPAPRAPNRQTAATPTPAPPADSWWAKHAAPGSDRAAFVKDAAARHIEASLTSRAWRTPTRVSTPEA